MAYFAWLLSMSVDLALYAVPITVALLFALVVAVLRHYRRAERPRIPWGAIVVGFAIPLLILVYGTIRAAEGTNWTPRSGVQFAPWIVYGCLGAHVLLVALAAWRTPNARGLVVAIGACQFWWSIGAGFVALMSVTGQWL